MTQICMFILCALLQYIPDWYIIMNSKFDCIYFLVFEHTLSYKWLYLNLIDTVIADKMYIVFNLIFR